MLYGILTKKLHIIDPLSISAVQLQEEQSCSIAISEKLFNCKKSEVLQLQEERSRSITKRTKSSNSQKSKIFAYNDVELKKHSEGKHSEGMHSNPQKPLPTSLAQYCVTEALQYSFVLLNLIFTGTT